MDATDGAGHSFDFVSPSHGWKTRDFELQATEDGGRTWTPVGLRTRVVSFDLLPDGTGWVVGGELGSDGLVSQLFRTRDWGRTWTLVNLGGLTVGAVRFADGDHGLLQSDYNRLFVTGDGGRTWTQIR